MICIGSHFLDDNSDILCGYCGITELQSQVDGVAVAAVADHCRETDVYNVCGSTGSSGCGCTGNQRTICQQGHSDITGGSNERGYGYTVPSEMDATANAMDKYFTALLSD